MLTVIWKEWEMVIIQVLTMQLKKNLFFFCQDSVPTFPFLYILFVNYTFIKTLFLKLRVSQLNVLVLLLKLYVSYEIGGNKGINSILCKMYFDKRHLALFCYYNKWNIFHQSTSKLSFIFSISHKKYKILQNKINHPPGKTHTNKI